MLKNDVLMQMDSQARTKIQLRMLFNHVDGKLNKKINSK